MKAILIGKYILATTLLILPLSVFAKTETALFAAGCFWCAEHDFEKVPGVLTVVSGYTGGHVKDPSYEAVSAGGTGHYEAIEVIYDASKVSYKQLLTTFWHNVDPLDATGQFCDKGQQYRSVIFYRNNAEKKQAEASEKALAATHGFKQISTLILPAVTFYPAEDYHQNYASKNPVRYNYYRFSCGRDKRLKQLWGEDATH
tara:strand:- start:667 stop:1269 length:603 start_codon:yes stop_codon:yes gene_type:complete